MRSSFMPFFYASGSADGGAEQLVKTNPNRATIKTPLMAKRATARWAWDDLGCYHTYMSLHTGGIKTSGANRDMVQQTQTVTMKTAGQI